MGTPKRERQKANRALAQQDQVRAENRQRYVRIGAIAVAAIIGVIALVWITSQIVGDDGDEPVVPTTTPVTSPVTVTTPDSTSPVTVTTPADDNTATTTETEE